MCARRAVNDHPGFLDMMADVVAADVCGDTSEAAAAAGGAQA